MPGIKCRVDVSAEPLKGMNSHVGFSLKFAAAKASRLAVLASERAEGEAPKPETKSLNVGRYGSFQVSAISGRLLGFETLGAGDHVTGELDAKLPEVGQQGAIFLPVSGPEETRVFRRVADLASMADAEHYPDVTYKIAASADATLYRIQFMPGGAPDQYVRIADCAVAGLNEKRLVELWLEKVDKAQ